MSKHISHLHACSVLKVKLTNIKLLFINFEIVTTDENKSIKKQFFQTVIVNVYIYIYKCSKIIDGKCNVHNSEIHLNFDMMWHASPIIPNIQLMIPMTNGIHVCRHTHLHPCTLHLIIWNVYQGEKPDKNFRPLNSNQHTSHDTIVCSIEGREGGGGKGRDKSLIRIYRMPS